MKAPRQFGPISRTPVSFPARANAASIAAPSGPTSAKPAEKIMQLFAPFAAAARTAPSTSGAGTAISAMSMAPSISATEGTAAGPCTVSRFGLTAGELAGWT